MFYKKACALTFVVLSIFALLGRGANDVYSAVGGQGDIEGVYEVVAETTALTKPTRTTLQRTAPTWSGIWQFQKGRFTSVLMKGRRDRFFDRKNQDLGFESSAGAYSVDGENVDMT